MINRRDWMNVAGLGVLGLTVPELLYLRQRTADASPAAKHKNNSCIFLFLFGGPSHIDLWDMKPNAPLEIRGEFKPIATNASGIQICEHLPRMAQTMDRLCLVRSMTHGMNVHGPACSQMFTGRDYFGPPVTDEALPEDWPSLSSMVMRYGQSPTGVPASVVLPWHLKFQSESRRIAGQTGGRMGDQYNAMLLKADAGDVRLGGLALQDDVSWDRLSNRRELLQKIEANAASPSARVVDDFGRQTKQAYSLLEHRLDKILDFEQETRATRERYGPAPVGQSLLMARRLVEADIPLVTVNWEDETKEDNVNTCWDTHQENFPKLKNLLCPFSIMCFQPSSTISTSEGYSIRHWWSP